MIRKAPGASYRHAQLPAPEKKLYAGGDVTRGVVGSYYERVADRILPFLAGRPIALLCKPADGGAPTEGTRLTDPPPFMHMVEVDLPQPGSGRQRLPVVDNVDSLIWLVGQDYVEPRNWLSRLPRLDNPDQLLFELRNPRQPFSEVKAAAALLADLLEELGLPAFVMATGEYGLQIRSPLDAQAEHGAVRALARRIARAMMMQDPDRYTAELNPEKRGDRLFIDYLGNGYAQAATPPYAVRAISGAPVAVPLDWQDLGDPDLDPRRYRMERVLRDLEKHSDPWAGFFDQACSATEAHDRLDRSANTV